MYNRKQESVVYNRKQTTKINNVCSTERVVMHGVPQGSILGPLLFLLFINDLNLSVELCGTSMYADDTAVFYFAKDYDELRLSMRYDMQTISYWMENRLNLNVSKTKTMLIGSKGQTVPDTKTRIELEWRDHWRGRYFQVSCHYLA